MNEAPYRVRATSADMLRWVRHIYKVIRIGEWGLLFVLRAVEIIFMVVSSPRNGTRADVKLVFGVKLPQIRAPPC